MTLDHYLRHESAFLEYRRRCLFNLAVASLGLLLVYLVSRRALSDAVAIALLFLLAVGHFTGIHLIEGALTRWFAARHGLLCPHCRRPFLAPLDRRPGRLIDMAACRRCGGSVFATDRQASPRSGPTASTPSLAMPLEDYLGRERALAEERDRWYVGWASAFFGGMPVLVLVGLVLPNAVATALVVTYLFGSYPSLCVMDRVVTRRLAARHGLLCPLCQEPFLAPLGRRPGKLIDMTACRRCGGSVVEPGHGPGALRTAEELHDPKERPPQRR
jgi:hypothetical protein